MFNGHWVESWSKNQSLVALSSAEFELYASVKATVEAPGVQPTARGFKNVVVVKVLPDAPAGL